MDKPQRAQRRHKGHPHSYRNYGAGKREMTRGCNPLLQVLRGFKVFGVYGGGWIVSLKRADKSSKGGQVRPYAGE